MRYVLLALAGTALLAGCWAWDRTATGDPGPIDTAQGSFRGVGIGDSAARMHNVLGPLDPAGRNEGANPSGAGDLFEGPISIPVSGPTYRYESASFFVGEGDVIDYVIVTAPGSETERGVAIGDDLEDARTAYPGLHCGRLNEGSEYRPYPACTARVAPRRYVWFGGNPISNITLGARPLGRF
jgi:hypothetical protein